MFFYILKLYGLLYFIIICNKIKYFVDVFIICKVGKGVLKVVWVVLELYWNIGVEIKIFIEI